MGLFRSAKVTPETVPPRRRRTAGSTSMGVLSLCCGRGSATVAIDPADMAAAAAAAGLPAIFAEQKEVTMILLGCDDAGKTSLAAALSQTALKAPPPATMGFDSSTGAREGATLKVLDVGGGANIRDIWPNYYADAHAAIFVVDAAAPDRFDEAATLLKAAASDARLSGKPLLVLANKQDKPQACGMEELAEALRVHELYTSGDGGGEECQVGMGHLEPGPSIGSASSALNQSLRWLLGRVSAEYASLQARIEKDVAEAKEAAERKKAERKARLAAKRAAREAEEAAAAEKAAAAAQP